MRLAVAFAVAALLVVPSAAAKGITGVAVIGADGRSRTLAVGEEFLAQLRPSTVEVREPRGGYLLVYPLMGGGLPAQPGRFYPDTGAACFSWTLAADSCAAVDPALARRLGSTGLRATRAEPTRIVSLRWNGAPEALPSNYASALELVLTRTALARSAAARRYCAMRFRAAWHGPGAASRPTRFCVQSTGLYARGRVYPLTKGLYTALSTAAYVLSP